MWTAMDIKQTYFIYNAGGVQMYLLFYFTILAYRLFACSQSVHLIENNTTTLDVLGIFKSLIKDTSMLNHKKF